MKEIPLTKGKVALVDDDDFDMLSKFKWYYGNRYAVRHDNSTKTRRPMFMHRVIIGTPDGMDTDHINGDKLDNRKCNLRVCTRSQNQINALCRRNSKSGLRGVHWSERNKRWVAQMRFNGRKLSLGYFTSKLAASKAYCEQVKLLYGEFADGIIKKHAAEKWRDEILKKGV